MSKSANCTEYTEAQRHADEAKLLASSLWVLEWYSRLPEPGLVPNKRELTQALRYMREAADAIYGPSQPERGRLSQMRSACGMVESR